MLTPPIPLHLSGPPDESAQLAVSIRPRADPASGESWFGRVSLRESTHKRQATVKIVPSVIWLMSGTKRNGPERLGKNQYDSRRPIRSETPAIRADSYNLRLCSILRKVRLMRGCMTPDSLGTSCLKFFCVSPAMTSRLPCMTLLENNEPPSFRLSRKIRSAPRLTEAITGPISRRKRWLAKSTSPGSST
jgi:hypothetical protein